MEMGGRALPPVRERGGGGEREEHGRSEGKRRQSINLSQIRLVGTRVSMTLGCHLLFECMFFN